MENNQTEVKPKSRKELIIERFLSQLSDQYNKNFYWRSGQEKLYLLKFAHIPEKFLQESFKNYLIEKLGKDLPTIPQVYSFIKAQRGFEKHWEYFYRGAEFCVHCRSDKDGHTGGYRNIFIWGYKEDRLASKMHLAKCNCDAGLKMSGPCYTDLVDDMALKHPEAQITVSYFDGTRIVDSQSQSNFVWEERVIRGTVSRGENGYIINWEHPVWKSSVGIRILECNNIEVPAHFRKELADKQQEREAQSRMKFKRKNTRSIANDGYRGSMPSSIQNWL